ncbi:MAG TPA: NRDE family protein [Steroidobacteraceae bacterium]|nr:NRDE family protein [Steroidobacteraceae bacterium]
MCLLVVAWKHHPRHRLVVAANRDEFHERPSAPLGWWSDDTRVLAGRDLRSGGTWMGVSRAGRFAIVTNFRDLERPPAPDAPSRGELVSGFLTGTASPREYLDRLRPRAASYAGFNLLVGDADALHYLTNRDGEAAPRVLEPGVYGLSNHVLDAPWPKLLRTRRRFTELVARPDIEPDELFDMLGDRRTADDDEIPDTGLPADWERALSAPFVVHGRYGTRSSTVLLVERDGRTTVIERRFEASGTLTAATRLEFDGHVRPGRRMHATGASVAATHAPDEKPDASPE